MTQICVNEHACVDIFEFNGAYYASIWIFNTTHRVGPAYDLALLNRDVIEAISDLRTVANIKAHQDQGLKSLQSCLINYEFGEQVA